MKDSNPFQSVEPLKSKKRKYIQRYLMTPAKALWILNNLNEGNPRIMDINEATKRLSSAILNGEWKEYTGNALKFLKDGTLGDGQHRLEAIVHAKKAVYVEMQLGFTREELALVDSGKRRSIAVQWAMALGQTKQEVAQYYKPVAITRILLEFFSGWDSIRPTSEAMLKFYRQHLSAVNFAAARIVEQNANQAGFRAAMAFYYMKSPFKARELWALVTGTGSIDVNDLAWDHPARKMDRYLRDISPLHHPQEQRKLDFGATLTGCLAFEHGQPYKNVKYMLDQSEWIG